MNTMVKEVYRCKCCGKEMKKLPLDICLQPADAEHARPMDEEDACDDFRAGE